MLKKLFMFLILINSCGTLFGMELMSVKSAWHNVRFKAPANQAMIEHYNNILVALNTDDENLTKRSLAAGVNPCVVCEILSPNQRPYTITFLHAAASCGCSKIAQLLLDHNVPVDILTSGNVTPLAHAIINNKESVIELLLQRGADVNHRDSCLRSPLGFIPTSLNPQIVLRLLLAGADVNEMVAPERGSGLHGLIKKLNDASYGSKYSPEEAENRALDIIALFRSAGIIGLNIQDADGNTPYHLAAANARLISSLMVPRTAAQIAQGEAFAPRSGLLAQMVNYAYSFVSTEKPIKTIATSLKAKSRARIFTFLCILRRLEDTKITPHMPSEVVQIILSHMPIECTYGEVMPACVDRVTLRNRFLDEALTQMHVLREDDKTSKSHETFYNILTLKNNNGKMALDIARDAANAAIANGIRINPHIMHILDPKTWQPKGELENA